MKHTLTLIALLCLLVAQAFLPVAVRSQSILGTGPNYQSTGCPFAPAIRFVRLDARWDLMNPALTQYVDTVGNCTDLNVAIAASQGKTIMFDFANAPAWVMNDPSNFVYHLGLFADHVARRFAVVAPRAHWIFGVDNEFWITNKMNPPSQAGTPVPPEKLAAFYYQFAQTVFQSVSILSNSTLNLIKAAGYNQAYDICRALPATNIQLLCPGSYATLHYVAYPYDPLRDTNLPKNSQIVPSFEHQMAQMRAWFPMCRVGSDEAYCDGASFGRFVAGIERAKPDMMILPLLCIGNSTAANPYGFTQDTYGVNDDGTYKQWALDFAEVLGSAR